MKVFLRLLEKSVVTQGLITVALVVTTCYLWATGQPVPNALYTMDTIVVGFFFGSKAQQSATSYVAKKRG